MFDRRRPSTTEIGAHGGQLISLFFLGYGLALGIVGSGLGMGIGLVIVIYLDKIEKWLSWATGHELFNRDLYYFDKIPALIDPFSIAWIVAGAMLIAVAAFVVQRGRTTNSGSISFFMSTAAR